MGLFGKFFNKDDKRTNNTNTNNSGYDWNNLQDVCVALGCLAGSVMDSYVFIAIQDRNEEKGWEPVILISIIIDRECGVNQLKRMDDYNKLNVPEDIARFLLSSPFELNEEWHYKYEFRPNDPYPSKSGIANELARALEQGCRMSPYVKQNLNRFEIEVPNSVTARLTISA